MGNEYKIHIVIGARPNFVKVSPLLIELSKSCSEISVKLIHTGQHYDYSMSKIFFDQFSIPEPDYHLEIGSGTHGYQTARVLEKLEKLFIQDQPDMIVVLGDVNSTLAAALAAVKLHIPIAHIESGLRSFDMRMPEEVNRILTDHISDYLFVTEPAGCDNLLKEGIAEEKIHMVGNIMIDALVSVMPQINKSDVMTNLNLSPGKYAIVTLHRPVNVDSYDKLKKVQEIIKIASHTKVVVFPIHPRTRASLLKHCLMDDFLAISNLRIIEPLGYIDFMKIVNESTYIMTDSGGIQSETSYLGVPCITLREATEHLITLAEGTNKLTGLDVDKVAAAIINAEKFKLKEYSIPKMLDGKTSERIVNVIRKINT